MRQSPGALDLVGGVAGGGPRGRPPLQNLAGRLIAVISLCALTATASELPTFSRLPLYFEANRGQAEGPIQYLARTHGAIFSLCPTEAVITLTHNVPLATHTPNQIREHNHSLQTRTIRLQFLGASPEARMMGSEELPGKVNYLIGNDPAQWQTRVPIFEKVHVNDIYPGVQLIYYGNQKELEYDFVLVPGADPNAIAFRVLGSDAVQISSQGDLILKVGAGELRQRSPVIYQLIDGARKEIAGGYRLKDNNTIAFQIGTYDHRYPLIIDPVLSYSTLLGGSGSDIGWAVALDAEGNVYVAGDTFSTQLATSGAFQTTYGGTVAAASGDAFVAKYNNTGSNLIYLTYLGGSGDDTALKIAVDAAGSAYVTGATDSTNFPVFSAISDHVSGKAEQFFGLYPYDAFVTKLDPSGSALVYSTFLGGDAADSGIGIAVDTNGNAYVTGFTDSTNFPTSEIALRHALAGGRDAFVTKIAPDGKSFIYSTYLGGINTDRGEGIAADDAGCAYITGYTVSTNFPTTNAFQTTLNRGSTNFTGAYDAFVTKLSPTGNLLYSTLLGGNNNDYGFRIAIDRDGSAYVTGSTFSTNFPVSGTLSNLHSSVAGGGPFADVFLTRLNPNGTVGYSTMFGGLTKDEGWDVAVDSAHHAYLTGLTTSQSISNNIGFPTNHVPSGLSGTNNGGNDAFITVINADASAFIYSAFLGGRSDDFGLGIAVDPAGNAYVVGQTFSSNFPTTPGAAQSTFGGSADVFLAKILMEPTLLAFRVGNTLQLQWLAFAPEFTLQSTTNLSSAATWVPVAPTPPASNGWHTITVGLTNPATFFRLQR